MRGRIHIRSRHAVMATQTQAVTNQSARYRGVLVRLQRLSGVRYGRSRRGVGSATRWGVWQGKQRFAAALAPSAREIMLAANQAAAAGVHVPPDQCVLRESWVSAVARAAGSTAGCGRGGCRLLWSTAPSLSGVDLRPTCARQTGYARHSTPATATPTADNPKQAA